MCLSRCVSPCSMCIIYLPRHGMWLKINFKARKKQQQKCKRTPHAQTNESRANYTHTRTHPSVRDCSVLCYAALCYDFFDSALSLRRRRWLFKMTSLLSLFVVRFFSFHFIFVFLSFGTFTCSFYPCQTTNWLLQWKVPAFYRTHTHIHKTALVSRKRWKKVYKRVHRRQETRMCAWSGVSEWV